MFILLDRKTTIIKFPLTKFEDGIEFSNFELIFTKSEFRIVDKNFLPEGYERVWIVLELHSNSNEKLSFEDRLKSLKALLKARFKIKSKLFFDKLENLPPLSTTVPDQESKSKINQKGKSKSLLAFISQ